MQTCSLSTKGGRNGALFVCFVDFKKAFDSVIRILLWKRLASLGINGKMLEVIKEIYRETKLQVEINGRISQGYVITIS